ncbi:MAG TPA: uracil-DNA glycosylase [Gallionellaceae bacterium]|nr:uracil-DNA glycosylase [Gallionellaceae bacterium]
MSNFPKNWMTFCGLKDDEIPQIDGISYPPPADRYRALELLAPDEVNVIILGQDPYHGEGEAHGLAFSVPDGVKIPPSLRNIFRELADDINVPPPVATDLTRWAKQGVLLLNTALTVAPGSPGSHANNGWKRVTDAIISALANSDKPRVFVLWGKHAQSKRELIPANKGHLVLESAHPSPLSVYRGFIGSRPFSQINSWLGKHGRAEIDWR